MKSICLIIPLAFAIVSCGPTKPTAGEPRYPAEPPANFPLVSGEAGPDDVGRFLAGKPVRRGALLSRLQQSLEYQAHQEEINRVWRTTGRFRANRMEEWANAQVTPAIGRGGTINYPFGGPDLLHVNVMFPQAKTYVLMGLEPVGEVPPLESMPAGEVLAVLDSFRQSIKTQLFAGYFVTKEMRSDLERSSLRGVTPILLSTIAMLGGEVESVRSVSAGGNPAVEVQYYDSSGVRHTAYYASGDLSNSGFKGGYQQWVAGLGGKATYFKAASYLMHDDGFSNARNFFLSNSRAVLQDDSGIPFRYFGEGWDIRYFGHYEAPIELFAKHQQNDLKQAYAVNPSSPLSFGSGYHVNYSEANLILALKR